MLFGALQAVLFPVVNTRLVNNLTAIYWLDQNVICYVIHSGSVSKGDNIIIILVVVVVVVAPMQ